MRETVPPLRVRGPAALSLDLPIAVTAEVDAVVRATRLPQRAVREIVRGAALAAASDAVAGKVSRLVAEAIQGQLASTSTTGEAA